MPGISGGYAAMGTSRSATEKVGGPQIGQCGVDSGCGCCCGKAWSSGYRTKKDGRELGGERWPDLTDACKTEEMTSGPSKRAADGEVAVGRQDFSPKEGFLLLPGGLLRFPPYMQTGKVTCWSLGHQVGCEPFNLTITAPAFLLLWPEFGIFLVHCR